MSDRSRLIFKLSNMSENLMTAKVLGHRARVTLGYGEYVKDFGRLWKALKMEVKSSFLVSNEEPGIITTDADISSSYIYVMTTIIMDLDKYIDQSGEYKANTDLLQLHINASTHSLRKYLRGRLA